MNPRSTLPFRPFLTRSFATLAMVAAFWPAVTRSQLVSSGFPVVNPDWEILVTHFGYADLALDERPGFAGREYLSGEWSAAVFYSGGRNPAGPVWFQPQWFFPDWVSNSDFGVETQFGSTGTNNSSGFTVYRSVITNQDLRITITYEMLDTTNGIAQGTAAKSAGGAGSSLFSSRYVFRQTYRILNRSSGTLTNVKLYQFLHGLETARSIYDDRVYAGAMSAYRYDNTQQGDSYSFDSRSGAIVLHHDTIAFHAQMPPSAWEVGYYGKKGVDSHVIGKPSIGVHLKVEADTLNGTDLFQPPETRWVSGAQRFELGTLAAGASATMDVLLTVQSADEVKFSGVNIVVHNAQVAGGKLTIDFEETIGGPVGFILRKTTDSTKPIADWDQLPLPYSNIPGKPGWWRFQITIDLNEPQAFFRIETVIQQ